MRSERLTSHCRKQWWGSENRRSAKQAEDTTRTEDKQCLQRVQRDTTKGRCLEEGCGKNMLHVCCDLTPYETSRWNAERNWKHYLWHERNARVSTVQWSRPETNVSSQPTCRWTVTFATMVSRTEVLFQTSFSLWCLTRCQQSLSSTRWLRCGVGAQKARCVSRHLTRLSLSARSVRPLDTSSLIAVCIEPWKDCCAHVIREVTVTSWVVSSLDPRRQLIVPSGPSLRASSWRSLMGCLTRWDDLETSLGDGSHRQTHSGGEDQAVRAEKCLDPVKRSEELKPRKRSAWSTSLRQTMRKSSWSRGRKFKDWASTWNGWLNRQSGKGHSHSRWRGRWRRVRGRGWCCRARYRESQESTVLRGSPAKDSWQVASAKKVWVGCWKPQCSRQCGVWQTWAMLVVTRMRHAPSVRRWSWTMRFTREWERHGCVLISSLGKSLAGSKWWHRPSRRKASYTKRSMSSISKQCVDR